MIWQDDTLHYFGRCLYVINWAYLNNSSKSWQSSVVESKQLFLYTLFCSFWRTTLNPHRFHPYCLPIRLGKKKMHTLVWNIRSPITNDHIDFFFWLKHSCRRILNRAHPTLNWVWHPWSKSTNQSTSISWLSFNIWTQILLFSRWMLSAVARVTSISGFHIFCLKI